MSPPPPPPPPCIVTSVPLSSNHRPARKQKRIAAHTTPKKKNHKKREKKGKKSQSCKWNPLCISDEFKKIMKNTKKIKKKIQRRGKKKTSLYREGFTFPIIYLIHSPRTRRDESRLTGARGLEEAKGLGLLSPLSITTLRLANQKLMHPAAQ